MAQSYVEELYSRIGKGKVDYRSLFQGEFTRFWDEMTSYLNWLCSSQGKTMVKKTKLTQNQVMTVLKNVVDRSSRDDYTSAMINQIMNTFSYFLHPRLESVLRRTAVSLFLDILEKVDFNMIYNFEPTVKLLVPYQTLGRDEDEREGTTSLFNNCTLIDDSSAKTMSPSDTVVTLRAILMWIVNLWDRDEVVFCHFLFRQVLSVVYNQIAIENGYIGHSFGFKSPPDKYLHNEILVFFLKLYETKSDASFMFSTIEGSKMIFSIIDSTHTRPDYTAEGVDAVVHAVKTLECFLRDRSVISYIKKQDKEMLKDQIFVLDRLVTPYMYNEQSGRYIDVVYAAHQCINFWIADILTELSIDQAIPAIEKAFNDLSPLFRIMFTYLVIDTQIGYDGQNKVVWDCLKKMAATHEYVTAALCRYSQMLGFALFQDVFHINYTKAFDICHDVSALKRKMNSTQPSDTLFELLPEIFSMPDTFVAKKLFSKWEHLKDFDADISKVDLPTTVRAVSQSDIANHSKCLIETFSQYEAFENEKQRINVFAVLHSFLDSLVIFTFLPTVLDLKYTEYFESYLWLLFKAALTESDSMIFKNSLLTLTDVCSKPQMLNRFEPMVFTQYTQILAIGLLRIEDPVRKIAFKHSFKAISNGYPGSMSLVPLMAYCIQHDRINQDHMDFLASLDLFRLSISMSTELFNFILRTIDKSPSSFIVKSAKLVENIPSDLIAHMKRVTSRNVEKMKSSHHFALFIFNAVTKIVKSKTPTIEGLESIFDFLLSFLATADVFELYWIRALHIHSKRLCELIPEKFVKFIEAICIQARKREIKDKIPLIQMATIYLLSNYQITKGTTFHRNFIAFLYEYPKHCQDCQMTMKCCLNCMMTFFGSFPYPNSSLYPTCSKTDKISCDLNQITETQSLVGVEKQSIFVQTPSGHFKWNFTPYTIEDTDSGSRLDLPSDDFTVPKTWESELQRDDLDSLKEVFKVGRIQSYASDYRSEEAPVSTRWLTLKKPKTERDGAAFLTAVGHINVVNPFTTSLFKGSHDGIQASTLSIRYEMQTSVVYLKDKGFNEYQLKETSPCFQEFISTLGWVVQTRDFPCELGSIVSNDSVFYSDIVDELAFHVYPLLPLGSNLVDDNTAIIWNEMNNIFELEKLISPKLMFRVIITPLPQNLFSVVGQWRPGIDVLETSVVISKPSLAVFVRTQIIIAQHLIFDRKVCANDLEPFTSPMQAIDESIHRVMEEKDRVEFYSLMVNAQKNV